MNETQRRFFDGDKMDGKMVIRWGFTLALLAAGSSFAQGAGRTDGPEGSEFGKGGYQSAPSGTVAGNRGRYSVSLLGGASLYDAPPLGGRDTAAPLFTGLNLSFWADDWFLVDLSGAYLFNAERIQFMVGPRVRTPTFRVSAYAGLQAGFMFDPIMGSRFGLSPNLGGDMLLTDNMLLGLGWALDLPVAGGTAANRLFLSLGYRF